MSDHVTIADLSGKLQLLLRSDRSSIRSTPQLLHALGIGKDYLSRIMSGTRVLGEDRFLKLCEVFKLPQADWFLSLWQFGERLGFSRKQIMQITNVPAAGIDFASRIRDERNVADLFQLIQGYWECFYYSVSKFGQKLISRDLVLIRALGDDSFIECEVADGLFSYAGWCFPTKGHLYLILEKTRIYDEIIVYTTNLPDRQPPRLYGIMLCLSGGVDQMHSHPAAARVAFRYIGRDPDIRRRFSLRPDEDVRTFLEKAIPTYLDPNQLPDKEIEEIAQEISNVVGEDAVPCALRMAK